MAICAICNHEMSDSETGTCCANATVVYPNGLTLPAIPHQDDDGCRCHDCNVATGGYHHPGCDMERCPLCKGQLISCGCLEPKPQVELCMDLSQAKAGQLVVQCLGNSSNRRYHAAKILKVWKNGVIEAYAIGGNTHYNPDGSKRGGSSWHNTNFIRAFAENETPDTLAEKQANREAERKAELEEKQRERDAFYAEVKAGNPYLCQRERVALAPQEVWKAQGFARSGEPITYLYTIKEYDEPIRDDYRFYLSGLIVTADSTGSTTCEGATIYDALLKVVANYW